MSALWGAGRFAVRTCWTCGQVIATAEPAVRAAEPAFLATESAPIDRPVTMEADATDQIPLVDWKEPEPVAATVQPREAVPAREKKSWSLALVGGAGVLVCVIAIVVLQSLQPAASPQPVATIQPSQTKPAPAAPVVDSSPAPTWVGNRQATWANDGSKTISFELQATHDVNVWMSRVRPASRRPVSLSHHRGVRSDPISGEHRRTGGQPYRASADRR